MLNIVFTTESHVATQKNIRLIQVTISFEFFYY